MALRLLHHLQLRRILWSSAAAAAGAGAIFCLLLPPSAGLLIGWDVGVVVYLVQVLRLMAGDIDPDFMRRRAQELDEGKWAILAVTTGAAAVSVAAILVEIAGNKGAAASGLQAGFAAVTVLLSWSFVHTVFGQHYAHLWYQQDGGLDFPSKEPPDYYDFLYFSFVIGMTFQVSDVQITDRIIRRLALVHGLVAFLFNTVIVALSVNLAAALV